MYYFEENRDTVARLLQEVHPSIEHAQGSQEDSETAKLTGKSFCVTGSFEGISRDQIHAMIEENGGEVRTSVSSKLDYLIVGSDAGSKKTKAEELGVKILDLEGFYRLLED